MRQFLILFACLTAPDTGDVLVESYSVKAGSSGDALSILYKDATVISVSE